MKVDCVIPAFNEEVTIKDVLEVVLDSSLINNVIVVDDGSEDNTSEISKKTGAKVVRLKKNQGKGIAMREGLKYVETDKVLFLDADLIGFEKKHISKLIKSDFDMVVGIRRYLWGFPLKILKIDPLFALSGIRVLKKPIIENISLDLIKGFGVETSLNYYCKRNKLKVSYVELCCIKQLTKEEKWGLIRGLFQRIKLIFEIISVRIKLLCIRKKFLKKD